MYSLNCRGRLLTIDKPLVMGIINATPDSFYEGSRVSGPAAMLLQAAKMLEEGADIIDVGGQSTRPGGEQVFAEEESKRVINGIEAIHKEFPRAIVSIDTYYAEVAQKAIEAGASIINDISAGAWDKNMIPAVSALGVPYIAMHRKGTPQTMHRETNYQNLLLEMLDFFSQKKYELRNAGVQDLIIDPGFGFSKTIEQNFELLRGLSVFNILDLPILIGFSRKSTVYKTLALTPDEALNGTTVLNTIALMNGASILRVHDVREARQAVELYQRMYDKDN